MPLSAALLLLVLLVPAAFVSWQQLPDGAATLVYVRSAAQSPRLPGGCVDAMASMASTAVLVSRWGCGCVPGIAASACSQSPP